MQKELLRNMIVKEMISWISSGVYVNGDRLPAERTLCGQFGVSRGTLRQALSDMEQLGMIRVKGGSGAYVQSIPDTKIPTRYLPPDFNQTSLEDILLARKTIELAAIELACENITPCQLNQLQSLLAAMGSHVKHLPDFLRDDMEFHQMLVESGANRVLVTAFQAIYEYQKHFMILTSRQQNDEQQALQMHQKIFDALTDRNVSSCKKLLAEHLEYQTPNPSHISVRELASSLGEK